MHKKNATVDIIPYTQNVKHLYTEVYSNQWDMIATIGLNRSQGRCEYCFSQNDLVYHTVWNYKFDQKKATVSSIQILCQDCYKLKTIDPFFPKEDMQKLNILDYLCQINKWDEKTSLEHIQQALDENKRRCLVLWETDVTAQQEWLNKRAPVEDFEEYEIQISNYTQQIIAFLANPEDGVKIEKTLNEYPRTGFRNSNIHSQIRYLKHSLARLNAKGQKGNMSAIDVSNIIAGWQDAPVKTSTHWGRQKAL